MWSNKPIQKQNDYYYIAKTILFMHSSALALGLISSMDLNRCRRKFVGCRKQNSWPGLFKSQTWLTNLLKSLFYNKIFNIDKANQAIIKWDF